MYNTAEECAAYAYEQARLDGQPAGFLLDMEAVGKLDSADVDILVLPPLTGVATEMLAAIREKHRQGINLVGFEDVTGLEDLFGVVPLSKSIAVNLIRVNPNCALDGPWRELAGLQENCSHPLYRTQYATEGAESLLDGMDMNGKPAEPVLVTHQTELGRTALFGVPPTIVNRADQKERVQYGQECLSRLMNRSMALVLRALGRPAAETTAGKLIAFRDTCGCVRVIVMEDAWPETPRAIEPRVTVRLPDIRREDITCDHPFSILSITSDKASIRVGGKTCMVATKMKNGLIG